MDFSGWDVHTLVYEIPDGSVQMLAWEEKRTGQGWRVALPTLSCSPIEVLRA